MTEDVIQLQQLSHGIKPDLEADGWHMCYYREQADNSRDEEYYFPLLILIVVLAFLLVLLVTLCIIYYCWKYCNKKKAPTPPSTKRTPVIVQTTHPPPPKVEMFKRTPLMTGGTGTGTGTLRRMSDENLIEMKTGSMGGSSNTNTNTATTPVSLNSSSPSHYGHTTATRPKYFQPPATSGSAVLIGSVSPKHRIRRPNAFRAQPEPHSTATGTDSSPGEDLVGERTRDPLLADRERAPYRHAGPIRQQGTTGSGSESYSLTLTPASEREPPFVPSPMEETYENAPRPIPVQHHDRKEISQEKRPLLSHVETPREMKARITVLRPFVPDPMQEITLPPPTREQIEYHFASEISKENFAEKSIVQPPERKRAQVIYHIPGEDIVAAY